MKSVRIITLEGDEDWVRSTLDHSLAAGTNTQFSLGPGRRITINVVTGPNPGMGCDREVADPAYANRCRCKARRFVDHIRDHLEPDEHVICKICHKTLEQITEDRKE